MKFFTILSIFITINTGLSFNHNFPKLQRNIKLKLVPVDQISSSDYNGLSLAAQESINKYIQHPSLIQVIFQDLFLILNNVIFPIFFIFSIISLFRSPSGFGMSTMSSASNPFKSTSKLNKFDATKQNITMSSWVGSPEVFEEVFEVISYLKNENSYKSMDVELPKGILLEGPPGTGKTLLAKAIASETKSNFISISGSEFVELIVGMGALKVRQLFKEARKNKPCIIFIDEIDAIGKKRSMSLNSNDEREQTLNQILAEMDGFDDNDGITILAATNRKDILDEALVRPGRFDRIIKIGLPDKSSREQILTFYLNKKPVDNSVDIKSLSEITNGFSGAQIKNLVNEAAILAVRENSKSISRTNLDNALEKLAIGLIRNIDTRSYEVLYRVAVHEVGHALLALFYNNYFDLFKVSIKSTYNGAGGYTLFSEKPEFKDGGLYTKDLLFKRLVIAMGGKAAESVFFGDQFISVGASQDLKQANDLARQMIGMYGMGNELQVFHDDNLDNQYKPDLYSDILKSMIDAESLELVENAYNEAKRIINQDKTYFDFVSNSLIINKVLYLNDFNDYKYNGTNMIYNDV